MNRNQLSFQNTSFMVCPQNFSFLSNVFLTASLNPCQVVAQMVEVEMVAEEDILVVVGPEFLVPHGAQVHGFSPSTRRLPREFVRIHRHVKFAHFRGFSAIFDEFFKEIF